MRFIHLGLLSLAALTQPAVAGWDQLIGNTLVADFSFTEKQTSLTSNGKRTTDQACAGTLKVFTQKDGTFFVSFSFDLDRCTDLVDEITYPDFSDAVGDVGYLGRSVEGVSVTESGDAVVIVIDDSFSAEGSAYTDIKQIDIATGAGCGVKLAKKYAIDNTVDGVPPPGNVELFTVSRKYTVEGCRLVNGRQIGG